LSSAPANAANKSTATTARVIFRMSARSPF
jgi:hypothetical protein